MVTIRLRMTAEVRAPPAPWTNLATTSISWLTAAPHTIEAHVNRATEAQYQRGERGSRSTVRNHASSVSM